MVESRLASLGGNVPAPFDSLLETLVRERPQLDDNVRALILESAFRVACSDGSVEEREHERLAGIADALGIYRGVLEMEIDRFQRGFAI